MTVSRNRIYLDHNASAPLGASARSALLAAMELVGNPSSTHAEGRAARGALDRARRQVAELLRAPPENVVWTSGASEAASTCLVPEWTAPDGGMRRFRRLAVLASDHACLRLGGRFAPNAVDHLPITPEGLADPGAVDEWLETFGSEGLLAFAGANNETGVVQPAEAILRRARAAGAGVVIDAVQMPGRVDLTGLADADAVIFSGHKLAAPKGVGAFVLGAADRRPKPLVTGGAQETRQRAGTQALPLIAAFGAAASDCSARLRDASGLRRRRDDLEARLCAACPDLRILGAGTERLPQTTAFVLPGAAAETLAMRFDLEGFAVSAGSACGSGKVAESAVLAAYRAAGLDVGSERGLLRISFGSDTEPDAIDAFAAAFERVTAAHGVRPGQTRAA